MLKIRLQRVGRKHDPSYRIVATNQRTGPKSNKHVAILGSFDAIRKTQTIDAEAVKDYISKGAQVSPRVWNILVSQGIVEGDKINVLPKKQPIISDTPEEETPVEAPAAEEATEEKTEDAPAEEPATDEAPAEEEKKEEAEEPAVE